LNIFCEIAREKNAEKHMLIGFCTIKATYQQYYYVC